MRWVRGFDRVFENDGRCGKHEGSGPIFLMLEGAETKNSVEVCHLKLMRPFKCCSGVGILPKSLLPQSPFPSPPSKDSTYVVGWILQHSRTKLEVCRNGIETFTTQESNSFYAKTIFVYI